MSVSASVIDGQLQQKVSTTGSTTSKATNSSTLDKDAFLQLLVAQMKYQDPLEPTSNTEYISQYATFSELEQMQNMSSTMELSRAANLVGQTVVVESTDDSGNTTSDMGVVDYISYETLSCSSYNRYNSDYNSGRFTETGADADTQKAFLKSAFRLILHNPDLYLAERIQLFLVTNGIYDYNKSLVLGLKPVTTSEFHLYQSDRDYGYELIMGNRRLPITGSDSVSSFLFRYGGEAYLPVLGLLILAAIFSLIKKNRFSFWVLTSLLAREAVIFLTAPASFIQYSYPTMFVTIFILLILIIEYADAKCINRAADRKDSQL